MYICVDHIWWIVVVVFRSGRLTIELRFLAFLEIPFRCAPLNDVGHVRLVIENLHDLAACVRDALGHDFAALHVALLDGKNASWFEYTCFR